MKDGSEHEGNPHHGGHSARGIVLNVLIAMMAVLALWSAVRLFVRAGEGQPPEEAAADKAPLVAGAIVNGIARCPENAVVLVLLSPEDFREEAYAFYHAPPVPGTAENFRSLRPKIKRPCFSTAAC